MKKQLIALGAFLVFAFGALPGAASCHKCNSNPCPCVTAKPCCKEACPCKQACPCPAAPILNPCCDNPCAKPCCPAPCEPVPCCPAAPVTYNDCSD